MIELNIKPIEIDRPLQLPEGVKIRHTIGVGLNAAICDGPAALGGLSEVKCSVQCVMPTNAELMDIQQKAIRSHQRIQANNAGIQR